MIFPREYAIANFSGWPVSILNRARKEAMSITSAIAQQITNPMIRCLRVNLQGQQTAMSGVSSFFLSFPSWILLDFLLFSKESVNFSIINMVEQEKQATSVREIILMPDLKPEPLGTGGTPMNRYIQTAFIQTGITLDVQASSPPLDSNLCIAFKANGFISTFIKAYSNHLPLEISPDDIWLAVCQGFSAHILENSEKLRKQFVDFDGKKQLQVRADHFIYGSPDNDWTEVFSSFSEQIKENIGAKMHGIFVHKFTTTTPLHTTIYEATLMTAMQKFFEYMLMTLCGIPKVRLRGTHDDWKQLREKVAGIAKFGLEWWISKLLPIVDKIVAAAVDGECDPDFWNSVGKVVSPGGSGAVPRLNGWIGNFFPYIGSSKNEQLRDLDEILATMKKMKSLSLGELKQYIDKWPKYRNLPVGVINAPFIWNYLGKEIPMNFVSGFVGVEQTEDGYIKPQIGWAVAEKKVKK